MSQTTAAITTPAKKLASAVFKTPEITPAEHISADVFAEELKQSADAAIRQQEAAIDHTTQQGITELERAEQDAQDQFEAQRDRIDIEEARALDNQALYAEARGDRGGIGQAQYGAIRNQAAENRLTVSRAQTQLATDTARQIADLRTQGDFKKADALLTLTQNYLGQLAQLRQWAAQYNLSVDQFNASLRQWSLEFEMAQAELGIRYRKYLPNNASVSYLPVQDQKEPEEDEPLNTLYKGMPVMKATNMTR